MEAAAPAPSRFQRFIRRPTATECLVHTAPSRLLVATAGLRSIHTHILNPSSRAHGSGSYTDEQGYLVPVPPVTFLGQRYRFVERIGMGSLAVILRIQDMYQRRPTFRALKVMRRQFNGLGIQEASLIQRLNAQDPSGYSHTVRCYDAFYFHEHFCFALELVPATLAAEVALANSVERLFHDDHRLDLVRTVAAQQLVALAFLHARGWVHADIKPENILYSGAGRAPSIRLADFGNAVAVDELLRLPADAGLQTLWYRAPEVAVGLRLGPALDLWSVGCVLAELFLGFPLFRGRDEGELLEQVVGLLGPLPHGFLAGAKAANYAKFIESPSEPALSARDPRRISRLLNRLSAGSKRCKDVDFASFLAGLLQCSPDDRFTARTALRHRFLARVWPSRLAEHEGAGCAADVYTSSLECSEVPSSPPPPAPLAPLSSAPLSPVKIKSEPDCSTPSRASMEIGGSSANANSTTLAHASPRTSLSSALTQPAPHITLMPLSAMKSAIAPASPSTTVASHLSSSHVRKDQAPSADFDPTVSAHERSSTITTSLSDRFDTSNPAASTSTTVIPSFPDSSIITHPLSQSRSLAASPPLLGATGTVTKNEVPMIVDATCASESVKLSAGGAVGTLRRASSGPTEPSHNAPPQSASQPPPPFNAAGATTSGENHGVATSTSALAATTSLSATRSTKSLISAASKGTKSHSRPIQPQPRPPQHDIGKRQRIKREVISDDDEDPDYLQDLPSHGELEMCGGESRKEAKVEPQPATEKKAKGSSQLPPTSHQHSTPVTTAVAAAHPQKPTPKSSSTPHNHLPLAKPTARPSPPLPSPKKPVARLSADGSSRGAGSSAAAATPTATAGRGTKAVAKSHPSTPSSRARASETSVPSSPKFWSPGQRTSVQNMVLVVDDTGDSDVGDDPLCLP